MRVDLSNLVPVVVSVTWSKSLTQKPDRFDNFEKHDFEKNSTIWYTFIVGIFYSAAVQLTDLSIDRLCF